MTSWADEKGAIDRAREQLTERYGGARIEILETFDAAWIGWDGDCKGALISVDGFPTLVAIDQTVDEGLFEHEIIKQLSEYRRLVDDTARVLQTLWYRRADTGDLREPPAAEEKVLVEIYRRVGIVERMTLRGRRHVAEALQRAFEEAAQFPEEIERAKQQFDDALREIAPYFAKRDPGESAADYERRRQLFESGGRIAIGIEDLSSAELDAIADSQIPTDLQWSSDDEPPPAWDERLQQIANEHPHENLDIVGGSELQLKRQLSRSIVYATEAAGEWDQAAFLRGMGFQQDWMIYAFDTPARVPLHEFVQVYDAAAAKAGWQTLTEIVREVTARQRFKEWP